MGKDPLGNCLNPTNDAYRHAGFWKCMDTLRDKIELEELWEKENPPWMAYR
jgi:glucose-1-phosphate cytidylyltransferase